MKKYVIGGIVVVVALFAVQERCAKTSKFASSALELDQRGANRTADAVEHSLAEASRNFAAKNYGACAFHLQSARGHFAPFQQLFGAASFRDGKTMGAWADEKIESTCNALATQLNDHPVDVSPVIDLAGLREVAGCAGKSGLSAGIVRYERKLLGSLQDRTVIALRTVGVDADLRAELGALLTERTRQNPKLTVVIGASPFLEAMPNVAGSVAVQLDSVRPRYFAANPLPSGGLLQGIASLADEATLSIRPDDALIASSTWKTEMKFQHTDLLAPKLEFAGGKGILDATGRPAIRRIGADLDRYPGTVNEFVSDWNRHFRKQLLKKLESLPALTATRPDHRARLLDVHELTGRISVDAKFQAADGNRLVVVIQRSEYLVRAIDLTTGKYLTHVVTQHASRFAPAILGDAVVLVNGKTQAVERWSLRDGSKLSSVNPAVPGDVQSVFAVKGCDRFVLCVSSTRDPSRYYVAVLDPVTGQPDGPILEDPQNPRADTQWAFDTLRVEVANRLTADADFRTITVGDYDGEKQIQRSASGLKVVSQKRSAPAPKPAIPPGAIGLVTGIDGPGTLLVARDGLLYLPSGPEGQAGPWPLTHLPLTRTPGNLVERSSSFSFDPQRPPLFFPAARRFCCPSATGQSLVVYAY